MEDRVKTGIKGLDELIGRLTKNSSILLSGEAGTGKPYFPCNLYTPAPKILVKPASM